MNIYRRLSPGNGSAIIACEQWLELKFAISKFENFEPNCGSSTTMWCDPHQQTMAIEIMRSFRSNWVEFTGVVLIVALKSFSHSNWWAFVEKKMDLWLLKCDKKVDLRENLFLITSLIYENMVWYYMRTLSKIFLSNLAIKIKSIAIISNYPKPKSSLLTIEYSRIESNLYCKS